MIIQISSGQGPKECELAVGKLFSSLQIEFPDVEKIYYYPSGDKDCYKSIMFSSHEDLSMLEGSVKWICVSPFRPHHKRKNWFIDVSVIPEVKGNEYGRYLDNRDVIVESFHCGGKGGQNVNKVETGVRLTHIPTGIVVTSTSERSQHMNRNDAMRKLKAILAKREEQSKSLQKNKAWQEHTQIERGNPVRVYKGMRFKLEK